MEIFGPEASGKTTLALHMIAEAQKIGGYLYIQFLIFGVIIEMSIAFVCIRFTIYI